MPHGKREEGTVAKVVLCRVEVSTATQTNRTAVPKSFFGLSEIWDKCKIVSMSVLTVMLVIIWSVIIIMAMLLTMVGEGKALLPKPSAAPLSLESGVIAGIRHPKQQFPLLNSGRTGMSAIGISVPRSAPTN